MGGNSRQSFAFPVSGMLGGGIIDDQIAETASLNFTALELSLFSRKKQGQRKLKHFTTASEIKSYQEHLQIYKPQEMVTQYACNKPAS